MAISLRELVDATRFLLVPGTPYPGPVLAGRAHKAALASGWQFPRQTMRSRFQRVLVGESGLGADGGTGLTSSSANRMRDYTSYLNSYTIPTVWKALNEIVSTVAASEMRILDDREEEVDVAHEFPALDTLLRQPNSECGQYLFDAFLTMDDQLTGNTITALDEQNGLGQPGSVYRLRPDKIRIVRTPTGDLLYLYYVDASLGEDPVPYFTDEVVHGKCPHPTNPLWGLGVVEAGEVTFSADRRINEFKYSYFDRGGVLEGVLYHDGDLSDDEYDRLLTRWRALRTGGRMALRTAILTDGAKYQPIQEPLGNVPIVALSQMSRNDILELFGVPPQCLGDFSGTNYRNAQEARAYFYADTITPILVRREQIWTPICQRFDPRLHAVYERREILDYSVRAQTAYTLAQTASFTRNDIRVAAGYEPFPEGDPIGQVLVHAAARAVELFPTDYEEPNDLLPLTGNTTEPDPAARAGRPLTAAEIVAQGRLDADMTASAPTPGAKARFQPPYPRALTSRAYQDAARRRQLAQWAARLQQQPGDNPAEAPDQ